MKLDHVIKILSVLVVITGLVMVVITGLLYSDLCTSTTNYDAVEYIYSSRAFEMCGDNFGIVNTGDQPITISPIEADNVYEYSSEQLAELEPTGETVTVASGAGYQMTADDDVIYQIDNPLGTSSEHNVQVRKF